MPYAPVGAGDDDSVTGGHGMGDTAGASGRIFREHNELFTETSWLAVMVGAAATAILGRDSVPAATPQQAAFAAAVQAPVSNKENKKDRLAVVSYALAGQVGLTETQIDAAGPRTIEDLADNALFNSLQTFRWCKLIQRR